MSSSGRLRDLIRNVRLCKTASEERGLIQKECAAIRQGFREGKEKYRSRNMLKLLYVAMLGYATEFGQMEVVKLLAQNDYGDKRIGYLTLGILMDETHEVLTLAENHIKKDLDKTNPFIQSLALDVVANVAGEDMSRDVMHEVQSLVDSTNVHLKKKACLAGVRIVRKVPEYAEIFLGKLGSCFAERNHGALLCSLTLVNECLASEHGSPFMTQYRQQITAAVRVLKQLVLSSHAMEHDVNGIADPFLQVKLLQFLRITGAESDAASEAMNDVLAQVATNTDGSKNVGSAILYECVKTINGIRAEDGLRLLGINTIGKFLLSTQNNTRFVALSTMLRVLDYDVAAVQRHQATIIDCLKDPDASIKRRALDVTIALIDESNVRVLVPDLLGYMDVCDVDIRADLIAKLCTVLECKSPTQEWRVQLSISLLKKGRSHVPEVFAVRFIAQLTRCDTSVHRDAIKALWEELSLSLDSSLGVRIAFLIATVWAMGEYGGFLTDSSVATPEQQWRVLSRILSDVEAHTVKLFLLTAMAKFGARNPAFKQAVLDVLAACAGSLNCEVQQRATEYASLLQGPAALCNVVFAPMPVIPDSAGSASDNPLLGATTPVIASGRTGKEATGKLSDAVKPEAGAPTPNFIDDLFGGPSPTTSHAPASVASPSADVDDIFGPPVQAPPAAPARLSFTAFSCADFDVEAVAGPRRAELPVELLLRPSSQRLDSVSFFIAVPKTCTVQVQPLPMTTALPGTTLTQQLLISFPSPDLAKVSLRIKVVYQVEGQERTQLFQVDRNFSQ